MKMPLIQNKTLKEILNDPQEMKKIKANAEEQFKQADKDGSNQLDFKEFEISCVEYNKKFGFPRPTPEQVHQAMTAYDKDKNGKLSLAEYQNMIIEVLKVLAELEGKEQEAKKDQFVWFHKN